MPIGRAGFTSPKHFPLKSVLFPQLNMNKRLLEQYTELLKEKKEIQSRIENTERKIELITDDDLDLAVRKFFLSQYKSILKCLELEILEKTNELEKALSDIDDSYIRRIITFRVIDGLSWSDVTARMGTNYTVDSIKKAFYRYFD